MYTRDVDTIDKLYDKYRTVKHIRDKYWSELYEMIEGLQATTEELSGEALIDPVCKGGYKFEKYKLSDVANEIEKAKFIAQERLQELNDAIDEYHVDICDNIDDGRIVTLEDEDFEGTRGRGLCGMDMVW